MKRTGVFVFAVAGLACPRVALADPLPAKPHRLVNLEYAEPGDRSCLDRDAFGSAIATRLGYEAIAPTVESPAPGLMTLRVSYLVERSTALRVTLRLVKEAGDVEAEKTLFSDAGACAELGATAAFAAAVLLDPRAYFPRSPTSAASVVPRDSLDSNSPGTWPWYEPRSPIPPALTPQPPPVTVPWRWRAGLGANACLGCGPSLSAGASLLVGVARHHVGLDVGVVAYGSTATGSISGRSASASLVVGEVFPNARVGPLRVGVLGALGTLFGESDRDKQASRFASAGVRAALEWPFARPFFLRAAVDAAFVLSRVCLRIESVEVWSSPAFAAGASIHGGVEF